ncbi:calaxin isoform X2 [Narcine bancroftii]|uniref:calaxin isoform X2 n=1 Tax=Narcine bancroftii TaxID=1343680 RepID=UPI003831ED19
MMSRIRPLDMSRKQYQQLADTLCKLTKRFNRQEVQCLMKVFSILADTFPEQRITVGLDRNKFRNVLHTTFGMTDDMIMDRVFRAFDKDNDGYVSMKEWIEGLSIFLRGTLDEKIKCLPCMSIMDTPFSCCRQKQMLPKNLLIDYDRDNKVAFVDFEKAVKDENLLLEAFGPCLPDPKSALAFEEQAFKKSKND